MILPVPQGDLRITIQRFAFVVCLRGDGLPRKGGVMAVTKFISQLHPPKHGDVYVGVRKLLEYILNPDKTEGNRYVGSLNCSADAEKALQEMAATKRYFGKERRDPHHRLAYHWVLSWPKDEDISEADALDITRKFCEDYFGENYEVVYGVHNDRDHMHAHICFNSVNRMDGYMYRYNVGDWAKHVQPLVDQACGERGYPTLEMDTGMTLQEYFREHMKPKKDRNGSPRRNNSSYQRRDADGGKRYSAEQFIKDDIDRLVLEVDSYGEFLDRLRGMGYEVRAGKYLTLQAKGGSVRVRTWYIGDGYGIEEIKERIAMPRQRKEELKGELEASRLVPSMEGDQSIRLEYVFSFRLQHMRSVRAPLTQYQKRNYYRMYRYSVKRAGKRMDYAQVNESLRNIKRLQEEMELADAYGIESTGQIRDVRDALSRSIRDAAPGDRRAIRRQIGILRRMEEGLGEEVPPDMDGRVGRIWDIVQSDADGRRGRGGLNAFPAKVRRKNYGR